MKKIFKVSIPFHFIWALQASLPSLFHFMRTKVEALLCSFTSIIFQQLWNQLNLVYIYIKYGRNKTSSLIGKAFLTPFFASLNHAISLSFILNFYRMVYLLNQPLKFENPRYLIFFPNHNRVIVSYSLFLLSFLPYLLLCKIFASQYPSEFEGLIIFFLKKFKSFLHP